MAPLHASSREPAFDPIALTGRICDLVLDLSFILKTYVALERFVSPERADELNASIAPSRSELSAVLHTFNLEVQRLMGALTHTTAELHARVENLYPHRGAAPTP